MSESTSPDAKLVRMANQIAIFFDSQAEGERLGGISGHINKFWEPRMRKRFFELLETENAGFQPIVREAAKLINRPK